MLPPIALLLLVLSLGCVNADSANVITDSDRRMLSNIEKRFLSELNSLKPRTRYTQFAVLYYNAGVPLPSKRSRFPSACYGTRKGDVFLRSQGHGYRTHTCPFIAARLTDNHVHTEQTIFSTLQRTSGTFDCGPPGLTGNIYLYSYNSPCSYPPSDCIHNWIQHYASNCATNHRKLIIGYSYGYVNAARSVRIIEALPNVAITRI